jgi:ubiquinone/menaquinone biosynthesis C-methylase UbiE
LPAVVGVHEGYRRWAPTYDQAPNPLLAREERRLAPLLSNLAGKSALDIACGTGRWLQRLLAAGCSAVGVDCSAAMLQVANSKQTIRGRLARADCLGLPFDGSVFDAAICSFALAHVADLQGLVSETARVMKPRSEVFVADLHPEAYMRGWRTAFRDRLSAVEIESQSRTEEEIVRGFNSGGFECLGCETLRFDEPEKPVFARAGKIHLFDDARRIPAVLFCRFRLL